MDSIFRPSLCLLLDGYLMQLKLVFSLLVRVTEHSIKVSVEGGQGCILVILSTSQEPEHWGSFSFLFACLA